VRSTKTRASSPSTAPGSDSCSVSPCRRLRQSVTARSRAILTEARFSTESIENIPSGWRARETYVVHRPRSSRQAHQYEAAAPISNVPRAIRARLVWALRSAEGGQRRAVQETRTSGCLPENTVPTMNRISADAADAFVAVSLFQMAYPLGNRSMLTRHGEPWTAFCSWRTSTPSE
jgi:hypothetical protein